MQQNNQNMRGSLNSGVFENPKISSQNLNFNNTYNDVRIINMNPILVNSQLNNT